MLQITPSNSLTKKLRLVSKDLIRALKQTTFLLARDALCPEPIKSFITEPTGQMD